MAPASVSSLTAVVLGKRKTRRSENELSLRLESSSLSGFEPQSESGSEVDVLVDKVPPAPGPSTLKRREKRYKCSHEGCTKAYTKPCRLEEHERSHTGQVCQLNRPFNHSTDYACSVHLLAALAIKAICEKRTSKRTLVHIFLPPLGLLFAKNLDARNVFGLYSIFECTASCIEARNHSRYAAFPHLPCCGV